MDDAGPVRRVKRPGRLLGHGEGIVGRERTATEPVAERLALVEGQDEERTQGVVLDGVDPADVWVVERGGGPGLAEEPGPGRGVGGDGGVEELERDRPLEPLVERPDDGAHPARAEHPLDAVRADVLAGLGQRLRPEVGQRCPGDGPEAPEPGLGFRLGVEEALDFGADGGVQARPVEERRPLGRRDRQRVLERLAYAVPEVVRAGVVGALVARRRHAASRSTSRWSHACASVQSRLTVAGETSRAAAVSSTDIWP